MEITPIGFILIPLGLILLGLSNKWLYYLMVFFIPFSATSVINISSGAAASGLQASLYFGTLLILGELTKAVYRGKLCLPRERGWSFLLLGAFGFMAICSLAMPLIINGRIMVPSPYATLVDYWEIPLTLTTRQVTQLLYLLYGIIITVIISINNANYRDLMNSLKVYTCSAIFVSLWGILQWVCFLINVPYPYYIFNTSSHFAAMGFQEVFEGIISLQRISSVAVEPSILVQALFSILPILLFFNIARRSILSPLYDKFAILLITAVLLLSTSSSAYLGVLFLAFMSVMVLQGFRRVRFTILLTSIILIAVTTLLYYNIPVIHDLINDQIVYKMSTYSGLDRLKSIKDSWPYFLRYPLLGIGWGTANSYDLVVKLLSNMGMLGFLAFLLLIVYIYKQIFKVIHTILKTMPNKSDYICLNGLMIAFSTVLFLNMITGFAFAFGYLWFSMGILIGSTCYMRSELKNNK